MLENDKIKTVILSNKARFKFSRYFDETLLNEKLLRIKTLYNANQIPIGQKFADALEEEVIRKSIHGTAGIEGNPLTEDEVGDLLDKSNSKELLDDAEQQIVNLRVAYSLLKEHGEVGVMPIIKEDLILVSHKLITARLKNEVNVPGKYRRSGVEVGDKAHGGIYKPPKIAKDVVRLMKFNEEWLNSADLKIIDPIYRAAIAHYHLGKIHPFSDGNGRTARLLEASLLRYAGYKYAPEMLSNYYYRNLDEYFIVFSKTIQDKNQDLTPFIGFMMDGMIWSLENIHAKLMIWVRKLALKSNYLELQNDGDLNQRQYDLLTAILSLDDEKYEFSAKSIFKNAPFESLYRKVKIRAAGRDLSKLEKTKLIVKTESGLYRLYLGE
ncbi:MAG: Fic family protein [Candidatus Marinimicrobia bacterium]|nr:Fic family protein [Candidatus Neomarinimicrobiota bacterium]